MMYDLIVVGGGPAGLAAACEAWERGLRRVLIVERDSELGGILNQCIHSGFGLHYFKEELTGPEYAGRFIKMLENTGVETLTGTIALEITPDKCVHVLNRENGYQILRSKSIVLAMGCRERTRGAVLIPGSRPAGVLTAGAAQRYVNIEGYLPGKRVIILGSGDIGLIMARRMTLEGAKVLACVEVMPYSGGLTRNIVQCLQDYDIPLYLSHTVTEIRGLRRVEQVVVSKVDGNRNPVPGSEMVFDCDTLLLSVGLIPENELSRKAGIEIDMRTGGAVVYENMETCVPGVFACGNAAHVHDLADFVTEEAKRAGAAAAAAALGSNHKRSDESLRLLAGDNVSYTVPQQVRPGALAEKLSVFLRVHKPMGKSYVNVISEGLQIARFKRDRMAPGEMEHIRIPEKLILAANGDLTISAEEHVS